MSVTFTVPPEFEGYKLGNLLHHQLGISSSQIKSAKWDGRIRVNGENVYVSYCVHTGDLIQFEDAPVIPKYAVAPMTLHLNIPYEDDDLLVIDKPAGIATSSSLKYPDDALENAVFSYLGCPQDFLFRPVNRLDKGTSGLMVAAKNPITQHALQSILHTSDFLRSYLAVTDGIPAALSGIIDLPIAKAEGPTIRREVRSDGKPSVTKYEVLSTHGNRALVRLILETGRTHQIRVHLSAIGCPVFGDFLYGSESDELKGRFALHSEHIILRLPSGRVLDITSPLPEPLKRLLS